TRPAPRSRASPPTSRRCWRSWSARGSWRPRARTGAARREIGSAARAPVKRAARERALERLLRALPEGGVPLAARWRSALAGEPDAEALLDEAERHGLGP